MRTSTWTVFLFSAFVMAGCGSERANDEGPKEAKQNQGMTAVAETTAKPSEVPAEEIPAKGGIAPAAEKPKDLEWIYSFANRFDEAELYFGDDLVIDFSRDAAAKYTLGGWRTRVGKRAKAFGEQVRLIEGTSALFTFPRKTTATHLHMRVAAAGNGAMTVYRNEKAFAYPEAPARKGLKIVHAPLKQDSFDAAEETFRIRAGKTGALDAQRGGAALSWMQIGGEKSIESIPTFAQDDKMVIPAAWSLRYSHFVAAEETLRFEELGGQGSLVIESDGMPAKKVAFAELSKGVSLSAYQNRVVRLSLSGDGEALTFKRGGTTREKIAGEEKKASKTPKNVLVFLVDTMRADKLKPWNEKASVRVPALSEWAKDAAVFRYAHTQENWTKPSVATLLSGMMPWQHQATSGDAVLPSKVNTMAEILRKNGFKTAAYVANGYVSDKFGFEQGFDSFRNYIREGRRSQAKFVAEDVLKWLDKHPKDPFFLYVHTIDPHVPYMPPKDILATYDSDPYDGKVNFGKDRALLEKIKSGKVKTNARDRRRLEALYDAEVTYHDIYFGKIVEGLKERGLFEDTVMVFTSDHGEEFFDHDSVGHGHSMWEELLHVPLAIRWPGMTSEGQKFETSAGLVDVLPTLCEILAIECATSGESLVPLMKRGRDLSTRTSVSGFMDGWRAVHIGRYKLIHRTLGKFQVFDIVEDPGETKDLAPNSPILTRYLRAMLGLKLEETRTKKLKKKKTQIDATTEAQLRALGYVGTQAK